MLVWDYSLRDLKTLTQLRVHAEIARANQTYESLGLIAAQIFGGENGKKQADPEEAPQTVEDLMERMQGLL